MDAKRTITVSENTLRFIECGIAVSEVFALFSDIIYDNYSKEAAENIIEGDFLDITNKMRDIVNAYLCISIEDNIGTGKNFTEI
jgi:hypothetical protein